MNEETVNELEKVEEAGALAQSAELHELATSGLSDDDFATIAGSGGYFPRLALQISNSGLCKQGKITVNHYALISSATNFEDLGLSVDVLVLTGRAKALRMDAADFQISYDAKSADFKKLMAESEISNSGCAYGPEYLVYIPAAKKYATVHCNNKSTRRSEVAGVFQALILKGATLSNDYVKKPKNDWYYMTIKPCVTTSNSPPLEEIKEAMQKFKDEQIEKEIPEVPANNDTRER